MATNQDKDKAKKGIKARQDAIASLIANHQDEFDELHRKNRVALGLPLRSQGPTKQQLEERIERRKKELEKWQAELAQIA